MNPKLFNLFLFATLSTGSLYSQNAPAPPKPGILLLAHGGRLQSWNDEVKRVAVEVDSKVPTEIAFGMAARSSLQAGIDRLTARGVTEIVAVPLFVSSHSSVIDSTAYLLGLRKSAPEDLEMFSAMDHPGGGHGDMDMSHMKKNPEAMKPVQASVPVRMTSALDHHALVAEILADRAGAVSRDPASEVVLLVAHGPVEDEENKLWLKEMQILADAMQAKTKYASVQCLTLRDDAGDPVRNKATDELRAQVQKINGSGKTVLVVPLLLSFGGIEDGLKERLKGLQYRMPTQGLLPDPRIIDWVLSSEQDAIKAPVN
ncbi:MAG TPA: CbiX/SirB N-terminal domain-containing protein [Edaphobacter sp.]